MGQSPSSVHAVGLEGTPYGIQRLPVLSNDEQQLAPLHESQHPPPPEEPALAQPAPMSTQHQLPESEEDKLGNSGAGMSPTKEKTEGQATVKHEEQEVPRIPIGRGALRKVYNVLKDIAFTGQPEVRKVHSASDECGQHISDDNLRQAVLEHRFKPKRAVFLRGGKRGVSYILPKQSMTESKRGGVWPSRARPRRMQTALSPQKQLAEPLSSTSLNTAVEGISKSPVAAPEVDKNGNPPATNCSDLAPPTVSVFNGKKSLEEPTQNVCIEDEGMQLETKMNEGNCSSLEEKQFLSDMERARQLSLKDSWPPGSKEQISHPLESVEKQKTHLDESEDEQILKDMGEACKHSLLDNSSPDPLESDEDPEATVSPLQSDEEESVPIAETLYRYLKEPFEQQSNPLDLSGVSTTAHSGESMEQAPDDEFDSHSANRDGHGPSPQPGPSSSKADEKNTVSFPLTEEQQFLRDMEMARQLSLQENWKHGMGDGASSDED